MGFSRSGFTSGYFDGKRTAEMFGARTKADVQAGEEVFAGLRQLEILPVIAEFAEYLLNSGNNDEEAEIKKGMIETITSLVTDELFRQKLSDTENTDLEKQAQAVNKKITDGEIRNLNILIGV